MMANNTGSIQKMSQKDPSRLSSIHLYFFLLDSSRSNLTRTHSRNEIFWDMDNVRQYSVCGKIYFPPTCLMLYLNLFLSKVVGAQGVGKTTLITQFFKEKFLKTHIPTTECTGWLSIFHKNICSLD